MEELAAILLEWANKPGTPANKPRTLANKPTTLANKPGTQIDSTEESESSPFPPYRTPDLYRPSKRIEQARQVVF